MRLTTLADFTATGWKTGDHAVAATVNGILATQQAVFAKYGITKVLHVVHLMAQLSEESGKGTEMVESLDYSPERLLKIFKHHFTVQQANAYGRTADHPANQIMIGELAYGGRMGNDPAPSEDGYNFRGRGLIQTTGKDSYRELGNRLRLDLVKHPEYLADPTHALQCAVDEFVHYPGMLKYCEEDNLLAVSSLINVGHLVDDPSEVNGYEERKTQLKLWKKQYGI